MTSARRLKAAVVLIAVVVVHERRAVAVLEEPQHELGLAIRPLHGADARQIAGERGDQEVRHGLALLRDLGAGRDGACHRPRRRVDEPSPVVVEPGVGSTPVGVLQLALIAP